MTNQTPNNLSNPNRTWEQRAKKSQRSADFWRGRALRLEDEKRDLLGRIHGDPDERERDLTFRLDVAEEQRAELEDELTQARAYVTALETGLNYHRDTAVIWADRALKSERDYGEALAEAQRALVEATR